MQRPITHMLVVAAMAVILLTAAQAQSPVTSIPATGQWPKTLDQVQRATPQQQAQPVVPPPPAAPRPELVAALARCNAAIATFHAEATILDPIDEGDCGALAPVQLVSIGKSPKVTLSQPAILNCDMVQTLGEWLDADVQPAARKMLGAKISRLEILSSYSCRNAYGRKKTRMSEHGRANAIDIKGFQTERNQTVDLLSDWGMTERDVKAKIAAAEAAARAAAKAAEIQAEADARARALAAANRTGGAGEVQQPGLRPGASASHDEPAIKGFVAGTIGRAIRNPAIEAPSSLTLEQPSRLGGPKAKTEAAALPVLPNVPAANLGLNGRQQFLRHLHATGCRRFNTALGPEANEAHRNHFHFDMAERSTGSYCR